MPSPFPGMDPYLEHPAYWSGFHTRYIVALSEAITPLLPRGYFAEVQQYIWLEAEDDPERRWVGPDVYVGERKGKRPPSTKPAVTTAPTAVVTIPMPKKPGKRYISIHDKDRNQVVTVVELLSPSDKGARKDRTNYLAKREEYLGAGVNFVEIDLLRAGARPPTGDPAPPDGDYFILVSRADTFPEVSVWAFTVRDPMPVIPVPVKPQYDSIPLALRPALDRTYEGARYGDRIDYTQPPTPALRTVDGEWAAGLLNKPAKKRKK